MAERFGRPLDPSSAAAVPVARPEPEEDDDDLATSAPVTTRNSGGGERIDNQVQKAQEQLLNLKRQQEQIERQKRELEELSRRQEELESGRGDMVEKLTRALVVIERQTTEAQKRVEQLRNTAESFGSHLHALESINPKSWPSADLQRELSRALGMVDHARTEYTQQKSRFASEVAEGTEGGTGPDGGYADMFGDAGDHKFMYWLKAGFAFTLPLLVILMFALFILLWRVVAGSL